MLSSRSTLALMAALALVGSAGPALAYPTAYMETDLTPRGFRGPASGYHGTTTSAGRRNAGISVAKAKRNARKARNVARNRRHHR